ncbi:hypothetical protein [Arthrobacter oryzae]|nr:hypothetical protein [Arthrobacter oryzae]MDQ0078231.1 hypothetical protein [Arthrobacter oryzae]
MNIVDKTWWAKMFYQTGKMSKGEYIVALGHLFTEATANREGR